MTGFRPKGRGAWAPPSLKCIKEHSENFKISRTDPNDVMRQNDGKLVVNSNKLNYLCLFTCPETCALPRSITRVHCRYKFSAGMTPGYHTIMPAL